MKKRTAKEIADRRDFCEKHFDALEAALRTIEAWEFDFMGDCVADARKVARDALDAIAKERKP